MIRRRRIPEGLLPAQAAFEEVLALVEPAKGVLPEVMPTTRLPGRPLPDALAEFEEGLERARARMPGWRRPETEDVWALCLDGIDEAVERARRLRQEAPELGGFEGLIWAIEQLISPLRPFEAASERFRSLRTRITGASSPEPG
jgi:hypothetical protein